MGFINLLLGFGGIVLGFGLGWMAQSAKLSHARGYSSGLKEQLDTANDEKCRLNDTLAETRRELAGYREQAARLDAEKEALQHSNEQLEKQMKLAFENTANALFENITTKFSTQSEKQIGDLLNPMRERFVDFQKLVTDSFSTQGKEQHTLKAEIDKIVLQTDSLTRALRGDVKAQGNWGEVMLERILEESGLEKGIGYITQGAEMGLATADGSRQQPDVIIMLPDNKHIIIDAKVSLTAYERYCAEIDETARQIHLKDFLKSVRTHVAGLEQKRYQNNEKLNTPDMVFMFMPIEGAFSFAMQQDRDLHNFAWGKQIVIISPTILFANLRTISSLWRIERQNRYAQEIARQGGALYDKFVGFIDDMQSIGKQMNVVQKSYDNAMNKLADGRGNLVGSVEKLRQLGVKSSKSLPRELLQEEENEIEAKELLA